MKLYSTPLVVVVVVVVVYSAVVVVLCVLFSFVGCSTRRDAFALDNLNASSFLDGNTERVGEHTKTLSSSSPSSSSSSSSSSRRRTTTLREDDAYFRRRALREDEGFEKGTETTAEENAREMLEHIHRDIERDVGKLKLAKDILEGETKFDEREEEKQTEVGKDVPREDKRTDDDESFEKNREHSKGGLFTALKADHRPPLLVEHEKRYERACTNVEANAMLEAHVRSYDESNAKGNVVVIDATSITWNGFGNNMPRWLNLFSLSLQWKGFATYFDFGACGDEYGRTNENNGIDGKPFDRRGQGKRSACQFDPGMYFKGLNFDWQWTPKRAKENAARLGVDAARHVTLWCEKEGSDLTRKCSLYDDENIEGRDPRAGAETLVSSGRISLEKYQKANGLSEQRDALNANWIGAWLAEQAEKSKDGFHVKIHLDSGVSLQREGGLYQDIEGLDRQCLSRYFFYPRENVVEAVKEVFETTDMKGWRACAAIHIRSGFSDLQSDWVQMYQQQSSTEREKIEEKFSCNDVERFVDALDETFERCEPDFSNKKICTMWHNRDRKTKLVYGDIENYIPDGSSYGELKSYNKEEMCCGSRFREPNVDDAMERCATVPENLYPELKITKSSGNAEERIRSPIRAALTCALRVAKHKLVEVGEANPISEDNGDDAFGVFLLGDTPAFLKFIPKMGEIGKRFVHQKNPDTIGHTEIIGVAMVDKDCSGVTCLARKSADKHVTWLRSVVDAYVAALCETTVQLPGSSFANSAVGQLRAPRREGRQDTAFAWNGETIIRANVDVRNKDTGEIEKQTTGYQYNLENFVVLSALHCDE